MSCADDIRAMLEADSSLGLIFGSNLFVNKQPSKPDECTVIFDTWGGPPSVSLDGASYEYPSVQIRTRSNKQIDAERIISDIYRSLHGRAHETWNDYIYESVKGANSNPILLDWDDNDRCRFIVNFNIQRRAV